MGDTNLAKALPFSDPAIFDDRLISFLNGLNLLNEPFNASESIRGSDIRSVFNAMDLSSNPNRVSLISALKSLNGQFGAFSSVDHGVYAMDAAGAGSHLTSYSDELRIAQIGPKVWGIRAKALYRSDSSVVGGQHMRWQFNVFDIDNPVYVAFLTALPSVGQVIASRVWRAQDGTPRFGNVCIYKAASAGASGSQTVYFDIAREEGSDYDAGIGYGDSEWFTTSTQGRNTAQLNLSISGILILP